MKLYLALAPLIAALVVLAFADRSAAAFAVCNNASHGEVNVAYAVTWHDSSGSPFGRTQGWWVVAENECKIVITNDVSAYSIYIYAFATSAPSTWYWGGSNNYCIDPSNEFLYHGDDMDPPCKSGRSFGMRFMNNSGNSNYSYFLND